MKRLLIFFTLLILLTHTKAKCDNIVINGVTLNTEFSSPFDTYPGIVQLREQLKDYRTQCTEDNCSFLSTWKIVNNKLMLARIDNCQCNNKTQTANLKTLFGNRLKNGLLCAEWFTGEIWATKDRPNSSFGLYAASWPSETRVVVKKGVVISVTNFVYPKAVETVYYNDLDSLSEFIYKHLNWSKLHNLPQVGKRSNFTFERDANGYLANAKKEDSALSNETYDKDELEELNRVAASVRWPQYYHHGQPLKDLTWAFLVLSKETKDKYYKPMIFPPFKAN
jgi:hypothetical protein